MRSKVGNVSTCFAGEETHGYEALQSLLKGEYTEESTGARTIRQSGGKDRHSKVFTSRGPRDRRVRLSVATAIRFYDLQDRLGFEQPSKAVEWLLLHCQPSIKALPQLKSLHPHVHIAALTAQPAHNVSDYAASDIPTMDGLTCPHEYIAHHNDIPLNHHDQYRQHRDEHVHFRANDSCQDNPLSAAAHKQDISVQDHPESSAHNSSSSGGSSDHPTSLSTISQHDSLEITNSSHKAMPMFPYHSAASPGMSCRQHDQSYSTSSFFCPGKRRRMQSPPACFSVNHHVAPGNRSSFRANGIVAGKGACGQLADHQHAESLMQRADNINTTAAYSGCSVISTNTGEMYEAPLTNTCLISNDVINTASTSTVPRSSFLNIMVDNSQPMQVRSFPSTCEQSQYIGFMQSQRLGAEIVPEVSANETLMSFQDVVGDDSLSTLSANVNDTAVGGGLQLYGPEMAAATAYTNNFMELVSPISDSNSINNIAAAYLYWQRKGWIQTKV